MYYSHVIVRIYYGKLEFDVYHYLQQGTKACMYMHDVVYNAMRIQVILSRSMRTTYFVMVIGVNVLLSLHCEYSNKDNVF